MPGKPLATEAGFRGGIEDVIILPLVTAAVAAKSLCRIALLTLIRVLDYAFLLVMQLTRPPLFAVRVLGDGVIAALQGVIACLPVADESRRKWRERIAEKWSRIRRTISYKAFEDAVHRVFERGMAWVFRKCRNLTPREALYVITGAVLWLPISLGVATAIHALLLVNAAALPAWMQLLHPFATIIAKSKLLVLPVYPAAWPQAKKHPFVQAVATAGRNFERLFLIQKVEHRYRQMEHAKEKASDGLENAAALVGLSHAARVLRGVAMRIGNALRDATSNALERLSAGRLIGPIVKRYASHFKRVEQRDEKVSEKLRGVFERWSVKFSAEYYEAKESEKAAKAMSAEMPARGSPADSGMMSSTRSGIMPPDVAR
jgi:hypothetical protein